MIFVLLVFLFEGITCRVFGINNATDETCLIVSQILLLINSGVLFAYIVKRYNEYDQIVVFVLLFSLVFKVSLLLWDYYGTSIYTLPNSHRDSESFHRGAVYFARHYTQKVENYSYVIGWIYRFFGVQRITAQYSNIILSFAGIDIFERITNIFKINTEGKRRALIIAALLPNYAIMSAILIRECIISVILCLALYYYALWWENGTLTYMVIAELISLGACWFHSGAIAVTIGMAISLIITRKDIDGDRYLRIGISSIIFSVLLFVVFMFLFDFLSDSLLKRFHGLDLNTIDTYIEEHNFYTETEGMSSSYSAGVGGYTGLRGIIINSPIRILYFLWSPMPWRIRGFGDVLAFLGSSLFYGGVFFYSIWMLFRKSVLANNKSKILAVLIIALCAATVFAWGVDSAGSALRHREKFYYIFLILFALLQVKDSNKGRVVIGKKSKQVFSYLR